MWSYHVERCESLRMPCKQFLQTAESSCCQLYQKLDDSNCHFICATTIYSGLITKSINCGAARLANNLNPVVGGVTELCVGLCATATECLLAQQASKAWRSDTTRVCEVLPVRCSWQEPPACLVKVTFCVFKLCIETQGIIAGPFVTAFSVQ